MPLWRAREARCYAPPDGIAREGMMLRGRALVTLAFGLLLAACAPVEEEQARPRGPGEDACATENLPLETSGTLSVGTSYPYYEPFKSGPRQNPDGFEPDIAEELASRLGLDEVAWEIAPFDSLYAPGQKPYDFSMDQISITPERAEVVDFSDPYYLIQQGLLVQEGSEIANATTIEELAPYKFGAQTGTTGLAFIEDTIQPDEPPNKYSDTNDAANALSLGQIDAVVIDVPIAIPLTEQFPGTTVAAQFVTNEGYGMAFPEKGSELVPCVNQALQEMRDDGTLQELQNQWLPELDVDIPVIEYPGAPAAD
ncbi:MAG TPA: ABC transporter substrate-binding protein [Actinomycetota bacterium]|nr:ABC transporter substrate-binding protein [Actinomycetota bacterium]